MQLYCLSLSHCGRCAFKNEKKRWSRKRERKKRANALAGYWKYIELNRVRFFVVVFAATAVAVQNWIHWSTFNLSIWYTTVYLSAMVALKSVKLFLVPSSSSSFHSCLVNGKLIFKKGSAYYSYTFSVFFRLKVKLFSFHFFGLVEIEEIMYSKTQTHTLALMDAQRSNQYFHNFSFLRFDNLGWQQIKNLAT